MALSTTILSQIQTKLTGTSGLSTNTSTVSNSETNNLTSATVLYATSLTIAGSATSSTDLSGSLTDPLGDAAVFATVMGLYIKNTGAGVLTLGGANTIQLVNGSTDKVTINPGASMQIIDPTGITVTASTGDLVILTADATGSTAELIVIGSAPA